MRGFVGVDVPALRYTVGTMDTNDNHMTAVPGMNREVGSSDTADQGGSGERGFSDCAEGGGSLPRQVLSFVRRSARLDDRLQRAKDTYQKRYLLPINESSGDVHPDPQWRLTRAFIDDAWGNSCPLVVEIGSGQGENIVAAAADNPGLNYLAVEVYDPGVAHTMLLAGKRGLSNLRIAQINAPELFSSCEAGVVREVWTFFPDPWPKMRHHKRRIVQPELAQNVRRALGPGGLWRLATDIEDYALHVHEVLDGRPDFSNVGVLTVSLPVEHVGKGNASLAVSMPHADFTESRRFEGRALTNFERKGLAAGRRIHDFSYRAR